MKSFKYYISERTNPHGAFDNNPSNGYLGPDVLKRVNAIIGSKVREDLSDGANGVAVVRNILSKIKLDYFKNNPKEKERMKQMRLKNILPVKDTKPEKFLQKELRKKKC